MANIVWPTEFETSIVDAIRGAIGRDTVWYTVASLEPCTLCDLDPVSNTATDSFCPVCSGNYWIPTMSGTTISGHVTWGYSELLGWQTGGQLDEGECRVQIKHTPENVTIVENTQYVIVDSKRMQIVKRILRGVKNINRILVDMVEKEK